MKAAFHTLGCKTNHYETDAIACQFSEAGFERVDFNEPADVYVINTCTVTSEADRKSRQLLRRAKRQAPQALVVAMGCHAELSDARSYADIVIGTKGKARALDLVLERMGLATASGHLPAGHRTVDDGYEELGVVDRQSETRAHIKIEDGCNSFCSYCAIPHARGRIRSRAEASILAEGRALAAAGYREVVLTGIHVCSYGADRGEGSHAVMALANQLAAIEGIERIRLGSLEPLSVTAEFLALARENAKLCPHFHLSLQSGSDSVLARMNRRYTTSKFREMVDHIRADFPTANLTTDIIVGFPGETEAEFMQTLSFCAEIGFGRIHVFRYSPRTGTPAASMAGQVDATISAARSQRLQDLADELALAYHQSCLGRPLEVLVEKTGSDQMAEGYSAEYVPVRISGAAAAAPGQIISVWPVAAERQFLLARHARAD